MTIPVSTIPAVKAALVAGITSQVNDLSVGVFYDEPGRHKFTDTIEVGAVTRLVELFTMVGDGQAGAFHEQYAVTLTITCRMGGDDAAALDARAWALQALAEAFVRGDMSMGGLLLECRPEQSEAVGEWERDAQGAARGRVVTIATPIFCHAVI